jgi:PAS domain S-box-containing protein
MNITIRHKMIAALVLSMAIVAILGLLASYFVKDVARASRFAAHSQQVLLILQRTRTLHVELQLAAANKAFMTDSTGSRETRTLRNKLETMYDVLDSLVSDNPSQGALVDQLRAVSERADSSAISPATGQFDTVIAEMQQAENQLKRDRQATTTKQFYNFIAASVALLVVWVSIILVLLLVLDRNLRERDKAETTLSLAASEIRRLYEDAPCGYFTVNEDGIVVKVNQTLLNWLGYQADGIADRMHILDLVVDENKPTIRRILLEQKAEIGELEIVMIGRLNNHLPALLTFTRMKRNDTRTVFLCSVTDNSRRKMAEQETQRAYKELESFSYSVSHDLRAPLRSINGYGQILKEDYGDKLDDEARRIVSVIINNGKRMGQLIDDLLDFSRMGRKEITTSTIDMNEFVGSIATDLMERERDRKIDLKVNELGGAHGDPSMLRQVWLNLISNAIKYSRKREEAIIEIGRLVKDDEVIYFVKDNGAGFSMAYYDKLFGVFQRLHKIQDFEGTGVGLALVKRIIERHGGKIWAESKPEEGATFYYSIPESGSVVTHTHVTSV